MTIRMSGLISGLDTDSIIQELVSAYNVKKDNYVKEQTRLEWKMDAWKSLNSKVYSFYSNVLSPLRFSTAYNKKAASISDSTVATVTADSSAVSGTQTLEVNKLATTGYLTGAEISKADGDDVTGSTTLSEITGGDVSGTINVTVDGTSTDIELSSDMTVSQLVSKLKSAGLNASFDETNQRFFISSSKSGADNDFSLTGSDSDSISALKKLGIYSVSSAETEYYTTVADYTDDDLANMALNDYAAYLVSTANDEYQAAIDELTEKNETLQEKLDYANMTTEEKTAAYQSVYDSIADLQSQIDELDEDDEDYETTKAGLESQLSEYQATKNMYDEVNTAYGITMTETTTTETDDEGNETTKTTISATEGTVTNSSYASELGNQIETNNTTIAAYESAIEANETALANANITTDSYSSFEYTTIGNANGTNTISSDYEDDETYKEYLEKYTTARTTASEALADTSSSSGAVRIEGADAEITLNGATFTSSSNNFSINGLTIKATALTNGEAVTITTDTDVDAIYDMIKNALTQYNELIKEMETLYNADSASDYDPLTDDEKDAMSDTEVEKWETKIKEGLLSGDSTLNSVMYAMKTAMSSMYTVNGSSYSLSSFGISTLSYFSAGENEKGVYHIDGDSDDSNTSGNTDKLRAAIANDPDSVISFFTQLSQSLYSTLQSKMQASSLSSTNTIYNDKYMQSQYDDYDDIIEDWEDKIADMEDKYYEQFSAMETALANLQSSQSALSSLMGS